MEGPDPLLGATVAGRYTVMRRIAKGGMGVVYMAVQEGLGRAVALKIIRRDAAADPVMQKRFEREARAVSSLSHPCIVTVHDFGRTDDGSLYLAMEFVDGEVLRDLLKRKKRLSFAESLPIVESIASALARAHSAGVVHRDLKPENVILPKQTASATGIVAAKVLDFGLAKPHDPDMIEEHLTRDGGFVGTPGYAAPEQAEGQPEHPRQDLYALGILWFEMLVGEHPFTAPTPMKVVVRQLHEEPPPLPIAALNLVDVPPAAATLVRALMARRPDDRPANAQAVLEELQKLKGLAPPAPSNPPVPSATSIDSLPDAPTVAGGRLDDKPVPQAAPPTPMTVTPSEGRRGLALLAAGALIAATTGAGVIFVATGGLKDRPLPAHAMDAGAAAVSVDGGPGIEALPVVELNRPLEVALDGVPTFSALQGVRAALPHSRLVTWTREHAVLHVVDGQAGLVAERLQGMAVQSELPLVLEVKELSPGRVVLMAVRPDDASALPDAGAFLLDGGALPDAGDLDVVTPGGLSP